MATYDDLSALDNKLKIHQTHLQFLANEIYQPRHELNRSFMWKAYEERNIPYSLTRGVPPPSFRRKRSETRDEFITVKRKRSL